MRHNIFPQKKYNRDDRKEMVVRVTVGRDKVRETAIMASLVGK